MSAEKKTKDGMGNPLKPSAEYYIEDARSIVGNCVLWWGVNGGGYTCDLEKAGTYEAEEIANMRDTDVAWPVEWIRQLVRQHVIRDSLLHGFARK